jgi:DNA-binding MarR family transcriptional regulator/N-acetylglutamate synthase-like GNAT family acetyltransferase
LTGAGLEPTIADQVSAVRAFNRFYTARLGLLRRRHLDGDLSLTESRILYEIGNGPQMTASVLGGTLELDAGYISRLLASLTRQKLVRQTTSKTDGREKQLTLTTLGERVVARLNQQSEAQLEEMLARVNATDRQTLVRSLERVRSILSGNAIPAVRIERLTAAHAAAFAILEEYYEAVHVVQRDSPASLRRMIHEPGSGMWLAYVGGEVQGCVVLRGLASVPRASECKRLYVKPALRGNHIAEMLLDAQEDFARNCGVEWIYLDSYDDLKAAIALYERRGYERCERYNDNPQATLFMRKRLFPVVQTK